jgi:hypothetical protein
VILFEKDWLKYPNAIIDTKTSNQSFVRLAAVYRKMGIRNHAFCLALINPALQGLDPFAPDLTIEEMAAVAVECKQNPFYFMREIARVPAIGGGSSTQFEGNRGNVALFWCFFNHVMIFLIQIRQTGKSLSTDELMSLLLNFMCENTDINLLTKDDILRRANIDRLKKIMEELPPYLQQRTKEDTNNGEVITVNSLNNKYKTHVPQSSEKGAYKLGRGLTSPIFHIDEGPFQPNIEIAMGSALAATGAAVDKAKASGAPYGTIITTTAGKKDDRDGKFIYRLVSEAAVWTEKFFDAADAKELEHMVRRASRGPGGGVFRINATFNHRQLGKTDQWLKEKIEAATVSGDDANRDFFNMWTSGSQSNPLPVSVLESIAKSVMDVKYTEISPQGYVTRWYIEEDEIEERMQSGRFVFGMDTSEASGGDDISLVLLDVETLEVIAGGTYNETNIITFSEWVCSWFTRWTTTTGIIERKSTGMAVMDYLLLMLPSKGVDPFARLYNKVVQEYDEMPDRFKEIQVPMGRRPNDIYVRYKKAFGFATSGGTGITSRSDLYSSTLQLAAKRTCSQIHDKPLIDQMTTLVTRNGRVDHEIGEHDDMVIGWLLCHWLLTKGKQLAHYGIDQRRIGAALGGASEESIIDRQTRQEQQQIRTQIEDLYNQLTRESNDWISQRIEHQLRLLDRKLLLEEGEIFSLDTLISNAREKKRERMREGASHLRNAPMHNNMHGHFTERPPMSMAQYERRFLR